MASRRSGALLRQVDRLFGQGTVSGMDEGRLLERFVSRGDASAFEALVARFGPMVLGICRRMLNDPHDVEDAFQASFLILVKKAATIRDGDRLGNWLYGVAYRVSARARVVAGAAATALAPPPAHDDERRELAAALDEELSRLPERYRAPIVLCYLQGRTYEEAAGRLRWPVGTVRSRMARARELLRARLVRRGVALSAGALADALAPRATEAAVPPALFDATVSAAARVAAGGAVSAGVVSAGVTSLTREVSTAMFLLNLRWAARLALVLGFVGGGAAVVTARQQVDKDAPEPPARRPTDTVNRLRRQLDESLRRNKELEAREASLSTEVRALATQLRGLEDRLRELAKPSAVPPTRASGPSPEVTRSVGRLVDQIRQRPVHPPTPSRVGLFLIDTDKGDVTRIADEPAAGLTHCGSPEWSWDGSRIIFDATPGSNYGSTRLQAIALAEGGLRLTDLGPGRCPSLSPDGRRLALYGDGGVEVTRADGTERSLAGPSGRPHWSPDGRKILIADFSNPCAVWLADVETEKGQPVKVPGQDIYLTPSWVGDRTIVAVIGPDRAGVSIALLDVTDPGEAKVKEVLWKRGADLDVMPYFPVYSAATGRLVFVGSDPQGMALYSHRRGQAGPPRRLEPGVSDKNLTDLAGSPDGRYVLFCSDRPDSVQGGIPPTPLGPARPPRSSSTGPETPGGRP